MREENKAKTRTKGQTADFELARGLKPNYEAFCFDEN